MSLWFFNILFDRVGSQVNDKTMGRGVKLIDDDGGGWEIKQLLYAGVTDLVVETSEHLQHILSGFERQHDSMGLKINVGKSKVLMVKKNLMGSWENVRVSGEGMQELDKFNYLGVMICTNGCMR